MTVWLLIITVFLAPTKDEPHVIVKADVVILRSQDECHAGAQQFVLAASQDKRVQSYGAECVAASDDVQKAS